MPKAKVIRRSRPDLFADDQVYSVTEIADALSVSASMVVAWCRDERIDPEGVIILPRGRRVHGWAINAFIRSLKSGA